MQEAIQMTSPRAIAGALATLASLALAALYLPALFRTSAPHPALPYGFTNPSVAIEMVRTSDDVRTLAEEPGSRRNLWHRSGLTFDFLAITVFALLNLAQCAALAERRFFGALWLAAAAATCSAGGALFDVVENFQLFALLDLPANDPRLPVRIADLSAATGWKWNLLFLALLLLSANFFRKERRWEAVVGLLYLAAGGIGLWGTAHRSPAIETGYTLLLWGIVGVAVAWFPLNRPSHEAEIART
jgi:hypothetical protein